MEGDPVSQVKGLEKKVSETAKKLELLGLRKKRINLANLSQLNQMLNDAYIILHPKPIDYHHRTELISIFNLIAKELYGNSDGFPVVEGFGSYIMDMFSAGSDLDLSVNFSNNTVELPRDKKIQTLRKFAKKFFSLQRRGHVTGVQTVMSARVPIVKVTDCGTAVECDISVENWDGILKSQIVHIISAIDGRFKALSVLMKAWARAHGINSSKDRTLNSLSIISLVAFHLQSRDPPILPPFSALFKDGTDPAAIAKVVKNYLKYGEKNKESVAELLITLLVKLISVEKLWSEGLCASLYEGCWITKTWNSQLASMSVEDFTDRFQNLARAVGGEQFKNIYDCIHRSLYHFLAFLDGEMQGAKLHELLFGMDNLSNIGDIGTGNLGNNLAKLPIPCYNRQTKKMRLMVFSEGKGMKKLSSLGDSGTGNLGNNLAKHPITHDPCDQKKKRRKMKHSEEKGMDTLSNLGDKVTKNLGINLTKLSMQLTECSEEKILAEGREAKQLVEGQESKQLVEGQGIAEIRGGKQLEGSEGGKQKVDSWEGKVKSRVCKQFVGSWGGQQQSNSWRGKQQVDSWEQKQRVDSWDRKEPRDGWGGNGRTWSNPGTNISPLLPYQTHPLSTSFGDMYSYGPVTFPAIPNWNLMGFERSGDPAPPQRFVYPADPSWSYTPRGLNPIVRMPYLGPHHSQHDQFSHNHFPRR